MAEAGATAHPEDHPSQPDALHWCQVQTMLTHTVLCIQSHSSKPIVVPLTGISKGLISLKLCYVSTKLQPHKIMAHEYFVL